MRPLVLAILVGVSVAPAAIVPPAFAQLAPAMSAQSLDCGAMRWSGGRPRINLRHIFCGEIRRGQPDGYHSEAIFPTVAVTAVSARAPIGGGLYNATVTFANGERKFSTFYPRACSPEQIIQSIRYAVAQPPAPKPRGWGFVAPSAPASPSDGHDGYCRTDDGHPFTIRYALLSRGDVNTAFPDGR
jgi:hypothetical protein